MSEIFITCDRRSRESIEIKARDVPTAGCERDGTVMRQFAFQLCVTFAFIKVRGDSRTPINGTARTSPFPELPKVSGRSVLIGKNNPIRSFIKKRADFIDILD